MSCEIRHIAQLLEITKYKKWLLERGDHNQDNWLQGSVVSLSQTGEILVIAKGSYLILLTSKWDSGEDGDVKMKYSVTWQGTPCTKSGEITSVLCLPLLYHGHSAVGADWTCIVVGFSSGTLKFYTEQMYLLLSEVLHAEPIIQIKCNSFKAPNQRGSNTQTGQETSESLYVIYKSVICVVNGFSLFQTLRGSRNRLARKTAALQTIDLDTGFPIDFKKYGFSGQDAITDASFIGQTSINIFDHLVTASLTSFEWNYRPSPPQTSLIIATGRSPFLGFHYTVEGGGSAMLTDVALAVATKIKKSVTASLPDWLGFGGGQENDKMKVSQEPAEPLRCRFGLSDARRHANNIITSPDGKLSAVSDSLGRVLLIENYSGIARRLWKGYREAQCGFLEVEEDVEKSRQRKSKSKSSGSVPVPRRALFLIIYAPKKGLIDVFAVQQGPCVASFKVSKQGRLIYTPYGILGYNNPSSKKDNSTHFPVVFLSEDGIWDIIVPFHCGLGSNNCNEAKDFHILRKIKALLKAEHKDESKLNEEIFSLAKDLKTNEIKVRTIEMLISHKQIISSAFTAVLNAFKEGLMAKEENNFPANLVESMEKLLALYVLLKDLSNQPPNYKTLVESDENESSLAETLLLSKKEMDGVLKLIKTIAEMETQKDSGAKVNFIEKKDSSLSQFLSCFDFHSFLDTEEEERSEVYLNLKDDLSDEKMKWIGEFIFGGIFYCDQWMNDWKTFLDESKLNRIGLMKCLISYWLNKCRSGNLTYEVTSLVELVKTICLLVGAEKISTDYHKPSPWWQSIRNYLKSSISSAETLLAAIAFRAVTITVEQLKEMRQTQSGKKSVSANAADTQKPEESSSSSHFSSHNSGWENVSQDTLEWDILIVKLEDMALLNSVLNLNIKNPNSTRPKLDFDAKELSLNFVLEKGRGYISELVAKWLTQFGLDPNVLIDKNDVEFQVKKTPPMGKPSESEEIVTSDLADFEQAHVIKENEPIFIILDYVKFLKGKFPFSLSSSSLLSNVSWEYMAYWYTNPEDLNCMDTSVEYLRSIPCLSLQHGLSYLCWSTYVVQKFAAVAKLINKFGKLPKDKFCVQEVSLSSTQVSAFLKNCTELLNIMLETENWDKKQFLFNQEGLWQNEPIGNTSSLVMLAASLPKVNDELLMLHYQLSMVLHMTADLNLKYPKIFSSLFDNMPLSEFFGDLTKNSQFSSHSSNTILTNARRSFVCQAITGAVQTIEVVENIPAFPVNENEDYFPRTRVNVDKATKWISNCYDLARMWDIPLDDIRIRHVCELYSFGFDRLAEEILPTVNESSRLASPLLVIAGERLKIFMQGSSGLSKKLSTLSPNVSSWLECLVTENVTNYNINLDDLQTMLSYILKCRPQRLEEEKLALAMAESIPSLENEDYL